MASGFCRRSRALQKSRKDFEVISSDSESLPDAANGGLSAIQKRETSSSELIIDEIC